MYYIFHGQDELNRSETLADLLAKIAGVEGEDEAEKTRKATAVLDITHLDGKSLSLNELRAACDPLPLFAERRVVIVKNYLARFGHLDERNKAKPKDLSEALKEDADELDRYLTNLQESLRLFFIEEETLSKGNPVLKQGKKRSTDTVKEFLLPKSRAVAGWITQRVKQRYKGTIDGSAAAVLAESMGTELRIIDGELQKMITYIDTDSPHITLSHIELLVPYAYANDIFKLVDSIGQRNTRAALHMLHRLVEPDEKKREKYLGVLGMIVRQFRILIQVKELSAEGLEPSTIAKRIGQHPFVTEKAVAQSRNFSMPLLEAIYRRLLETDLDMKTGKTKEMLALDTLVVALCGPPD
jgi:DNA polymerase III subunit delta